MKNLSSCPACSYQGELSKFIHMKNVGVYEKIFFECPSCKKQLALKFFYIYILTGVFTLCLILSLFFLSVSLSATTFLFGTIFLCIWIFKRQGYLSHLDKVIFVESCS